MPRKVDSMAINNPKLDKRVRLSDEDKKNVVKDYESGLYSIRALERKYKVSRRLIQFTLFPERAEHAKKLYKERRKDGRYYDKDKHREGTQKHRDYKDELLKQGLINKED